MPLIPLVVALLLPLVLVLALPFSLVQRYRAGTARRPARRWVATTNFVLMIFSAVVFLWAASLTNFWVPKAFSSALMGFGGGTVLGLLGVALTRWEQTPRGLYYTPNRWLILLLVVAISGRILYSFWRGWHAWTAGERGTAWLTESGAAGALAVGALVVGYYFAYSTGLWRRTRRLA